MKKALCIPVLIICLLGTLDTAVCGQTRPTGKAETVITAMGGPKETNDSNKSRDIIIQQQLTWQIIPKAFPLAFAGDLQVKRDTLTPLALDKGELVITGADWQVRAFSNKGFGGTLDPLRLLSSSRRSEQFIGLESKGKLGKTLFRTMWVSEIASLGDDGPLFLADLALDPRILPGQYRYLYINHDSDLVWHHPKAGTYGTRTKREIHGLVAHWNVARGLDLSSEVAILKGFDLKKTYRHDLEGLALLVRGEGVLGGIDWTIDLHRTNHGFVLATGDGDSPKPGSVGGRLKLVKGRYQASSWQLALGQETRRQEVDGDSLSHTFGEITHRRRFSSFSHRLGLTYGLKEGQGVPGGFWEGNWRPMGLQIGGRWNPQDTGTSQLYGKVTLRPNLTLNLRWEPDSAAVRVALLMESALSNTDGLPRWRGEVVLKSRPHQDYTYVSLQHRMDKGYIEVRLGKWDQGHLDWAWGKPPETSIALGRYF